MSFLHVVKWPYRRYGCTNTVTDMIDKQTVTDAVMKAIEGTDLFVVDVRFAAADSIIVEVDSPDSLDIDTCSDITRRIREELGDGLDEYDLEVGSAGITAPFKVRAQYLKNIGNDVEVLTADGRKLRGVLTAVGDDTFSIEYGVKVKNPGDKRPHIEMQTEQIAYDNARRVAYDLKV